MGATLSTRKSKSGIAALRSQTGARRERGEELLHGAPHFIATRKTVPVGAYQTHEFEALIYWQQIILVHRESMLRSQAIHQQAFDIRLQREKLQVLGDNLVPGLERQQRFGCARRAGIDGNYAARLAALVEEGHVDGDHERVPLAIGDAEIGQKADTARHPFVALAGLLTEEDGTGLAGANQFPGGWLDEMFVIAGQACSTQIATFLLGIATHEALQRSETAGIGRARLSRHAPPSRAVRS